MDFSYVMKEGKEKAMTTLMIFQVITGSLLRKYFTLSYQISNEYEYTLSADKSLPVVLEAWKKGRKGKSVKATLTLDEQEAIYKIFDMLEVEQQV